MSQPTVPATVSPFEPSLVPSPVSSYEQTPAPAPILAPALALESVPDPAPVSALEPVPPGALSTLVPAPAPVLSLEHISVPTPAPSSSFEPIPNPFQTPAGDDSMGHAPVPTLTPASSSLEPTPVPSNDITPPPTTAYSERRSPSPPRPDDVPSTNTTIPTSIYSQPPPTVKRLFQDMTKLEIVEELERQNFTISHLKKVDVPGGEAGSDVRDPALNAYYDEALIVRCLATIHELRRNPHTILHKDRFLVHPSDDFFYHQNRAFLVDW
eukprot:CAMPEP_0172486162 /NCGR_PEP_ID=MMETSP1066-20121228/14612_1 /TAXON_ID=671091 /ORGANISM="Coscinodiscus wailesii, Strain CCMP2513" /LENGTH=267 /DNA_ID=CAMNT_0013251933 /DNA_START=50 /DNA_END=850 /DNA_ORIENTATION=+